MTPATSLATAANNSSELAPLATSVATRRRAACSPARSRARASEAASSARLSVFAIAVATSSVNFSTRFSAFAGGWSSPLQLAPIMPQSAPSTTIGAPTVALTLSRRSTSAMLPLPSSAKLSRAERPVRRMRAFTLSPSSGRRTSVRRISGLWPRIARTEISCSFS